MSGPATQKARLPNCVLLRFTAHGSGSSSEGAKLAYIRVGRSKHDKVTGTTGIDGGKSDA